MDVNLLEANLTEIEVSFDGAATWYKLRNVSNYSETEAEIPVTNKSMLDGVVTTVGKRQPSTISCQLEYLPQSEVNKKLYNAFVNGDIIQVKWRTRERKIADAGQLTISNGTTLAKDNFKFSAGQAIHVDGRDYVVESENKLGTDELNKSGESDTILYDKITIPRVERPTFAARVTAADQASFNADESVQSTLSMQSIEPLPASQIVNAYVEGREAVGLKADKTYLTMSYSDAETPPNREMALLLVAKGNVRLVKINELDKAHVADWVIGNRLYSYLGDNEDLDIWKFDGENLVRDTDETITSDVAVAAGWEIISSYWSEYWRAVMLLGLNTTTKQWWVRPCKITIKDGKRHLSKGADPVAVGYLNKKSGNNSNVEWKPYGICQHPTEPSKAVLGVQESNKRKRKIIPIGFEVNFEYNNAGDLIRTPTIDKFIFMGRSLRTEEEKTLLCLTRQSKELYAVEVSKGEISLSIISYIKFKSLSLEVDKKYTGLGVEKRGVIEVINLMLFGAGNIIEAADTSVTIDQNLVVHTINNF